METRSQEREDVGLLAILAAAVNLRIAIVAIGPLLSEIRGDLGMSGPVAGLLSAVPFLCMGIFALFGPSLLSRTGVMRTVGWCLVGLGIATVARAAMPTAALVIAWTIPIGIAIALAGIALPTIVKQANPGKAGRFTGYYVAAMSLGAGITTLGIVPLSSLVGGWRGAMAVTAVPCLLALPIWLRARHRLARTESRTWRLRGLTGSHIRLGLIFAAASVGFTGTIAWVSPLYLDAGWSPGFAGAVSGAIMLLTIPSSLLFPGLSDGLDRRRWIAVSGVLLGIGMLGFGLAPLAAAPLWIIAFSVGNGALFPLVLTLPVDAGRDREGVAQATAWTMAIGFTCGSTGPILVGALLDLSGGFALPMSALAVIAGAGAALALTGPGTRAADEISPG